MGTKTLDCTFLLDTGKTIKKRYLVLIASVLTFWNFPVTHFVGCYQKVLMVHSWMLPTHFKTSVGIGRINYQYSIFQYGFECITQDVLIMALAKPYASAQKIDPFCAFIYTSKVYHKMPCL